MMTARIAAVGLGGLGRIECEQYAKMDDVELVAGMDVSETAQEWFEANFDAPTYDDVTVLLDEHAGQLDAVNIATPHTLHYEQASRSLDAGLDVFLEKPMTTDLDEAKDLVRQAKANDAILEIGYQRHFDPLFAEIKRLVDAGRIGDIHSATCFLSQDWIDVHEDSWRTNPALSGGGQLYDSGSHLLDTLLWTTGGEPQRVSAMVDMQGNDVDVNSALAATLDIHGRTVTASISVSGDGTSMEPEEGLVLVGTDGHLSYLNGVLTVTESDGGTYTANTVEQDFHEQTHAKLADFVESVRTRNEPAVPGEYGVHVTALTEAAYEASRTGEAVDVQALMDRDVSIEGKNVASSSKQESSCRQTR